jgi:hypothetical protein
VRQEPRAETAFHREWAHPRSLPVDDSATGHALTAPSKQAYSRIQTKLQPDCVVCGEVDDGWTSAAVDRDVTAKQISIAAVVRLLTRVNMNYCDRCEKSYSEDFRFCPADGTTLRSAVECEKQHCIAVSAGHDGRSNVHIRRWFYAVLAVAIAIGALFVFSSSRVAQSRDQADSQLPVADEGKTKAKPAAKRTAVSPRRATHSGGAAKADEPRSATDDLAQQVRAQQLVATGYRRIQQRDYESARAAFEEALEIDPHNSAAQKGLNAAQTAESVEGVADVFRR